MSLEAKAGSTGGTVSLFQDVKGTRPYLNTKYGLSEIVRAFRSFSARRINQIRHKRGIAVWQRNFYDRVIRNQSELDRTRQYIIDHPLNWKTDDENPGR